VGEAFSMNIDVAVVIVSWNVREYLADCLRSVCADITRSRLRGEIFVVDNASTDGSVAVVKEDFSNIRLIEHCENVGFAGRSACREGHERF